MSVVAFATRVSAVALGLAALALPMLMGAPSSAFDCFAPLQFHRYGDCGHFPDDPDILRVPAHSSGTVVSRWEYFAGGAPLYPWRINNRGSEDIAVFLRSEEEFDSFLTRARNDPTLDVCEVKDRDWTWVGGWGQCTDGYGRNPYPCPLTVCGVHFVYIATYCPRNFATSCGGKAICRPPGAVFVRYTVIANPPC